MRLLNKEEVLEKLKDVESQRMAKWYADNFVCYETKDNKLLTFKKRPSISSTIYYDDETEPPEITLDYFKYYNRHNMDEYIAIEPFNDDKRPYFIDRYCTDKLRVAVIQNNEHKWISYEEELQNCKNKNIFQRFLDDDEIQEYNRIIEELREKYNKRLENYYKKYKDKIYASGYWANR